MTKTLLAVDDSVTMRKVLEITFSGEDFRVLTADSSQAALAKLNENPAVFVVDSVLGGEDGYALARELRKRNPHAPIVMLASRYTPYDQGRGRDAGADDWADKPFDTQQLIDKVKKILVAKDAVAAAHAGPPMGTGLPYRAPAPPQPPLAPLGSPSGVAGAIGRPQPGAVGPRGGTLVFGEGQAQQAQSPKAPAVAPAMPPRPAPSPAVAPGTAPSPITAAVNGQLAGKLGDIGLTPQQAEAVLALSREVVERVVWEVVPQMAETLIKEEIARLMRE